MTSKEIQENSVKLLEFVKKFGKLSIAKLSKVNEETGEEREFKELAFTHPTKKDDKGRAQVTFCSFSHNLGELTGAEIKRDLDKLHVLTYKKDGKDKYSLWREGDGWEEVDLGVEF